jgi:hypothetical protein
MNIWTYSTFKLVFSQSDIKDKIRNIFLFETLLSMILFEVKSSPLV